MKSLKLSIALMITALMIAGAATAALSTLSLDRSVSAGTVLVDTDSGAAVSFTALGSYGTSGVMVTDGTTGEVSFNMVKALGAAGTGFNTSGTYTIGSASAGVFSITNNSDIAITVALASATGGLTLNAVTSATVAAGATGTFYFSINTAAQNETTTIGGTIQVRNA